MLEPLSMPSQDLFLLSLWPEGVQRGIRVAEFGAGLICQVKVLASKYLPSLWNVSLGTCSFILGEEPCRFFWKMGCLE